MIKDEIIIKHSFAENDAKKGRSVLTKNGVLSADKLFELHEKFKTQMRKSIQANLKKEENQ